MSSNEGRKGIFSDLLSIAYKKIQHFRGWWLNHPSVGIEVFLDLQGRHLQQVTGFCLTLCGCNHDIREEEFKKKSW